MSEDVEFNNGFVTALALFYGHREQFQREQELLKHDLRIYGASDHLFDIEYPANLDKNLRNKIEKFVSDVFDVRLKSISVSDANELFDRCYGLLMEIDKMCFDLDVKVKFA